MQPIFFQILANPFSGFLLKQSAQIARGSVGAFRQLLKIQLFSIVLADIFFSNGHDWMLFLCRIAFVESARLFNDILNQSDYFIGTIAFIDLLHGGHNIEIGKNRAFLHDFMEYAGTEKFGIEQGIFLFSVKIPILLHDYL